LQLDNVTLPDLSGFDSLGDERQCISTNRGSQCVETMLLTPTVPGDRTIAGATLEAIDARSGRGVRFSSNPVTIHVQGDPLPNYFLQALVDGLVRPVIVLLIVAAVGYAALWGWRRRPKPAPPLAPPPVPPAVTPPPPVPPLRSLVEALAATPSRANVLAVRGELRRGIGAREEETLADLRARGATRGNADLDAALRATEIAAFADEPRLPTTIAEALGPLRRLAGPSVEAAL
jgi:hypothetical protein